MEAPESDQEVDSGPEREAVTSENNFISYHFSKKGK